MSLAKRTRTTLHPRHQMKLDTVRGVAMEQGRLYRLWVNGKIKSSEMTRGMFGLREIRCSLEAIPLPPASEIPRAFNIVTIPSGTHFPGLSELSSAGSHRVIEHQPSSDSPVLDPQLALRSGLKEKDCAQDIDEPAAAPEPESDDAMRIVATPDVVEAAPLDEPDPVMKRAMAMGYTPLPPRS